LRYQAERRDQPPARYDGGYPRGRGSDGWGARWRPERYDSPVRLEETGIRGPARYGLGPYHERLRQRRRSDEELRQDVEDALFYDTWVDADAIEVRVREGVVTLEGELPSYDEVRFATDDAWDVEGVVGVRPELRVRPG